MKENSREQEFIGKEVAKRIVKEGKGGLEKGGKTALNNAVR